MDLRTIAPPHRQARLIDALIDRLPVEARDQRLRRRFARRGAILIALQPLLGLLQQGLEGGAARRPGVARHLGEDLGQRGARGVAAGGGALIHHRHLGLIESRHLDRGEQARHDQQRQRENGHHHTYHRKSMPSSKRCMRQIIHVYPAARVRERGTSRGAAATLALQFQNPTTNRTTRATALLPKGPYVIATRARTSTQAAAWSIASNPSPRARSVLVCWEASAASAPCSRSQAVTGSRCWCRAPTASARN